MSGSMGNNEQNWDAPQDLWDFNEQPDMNSWNANDLDFGQAQPQFPHPASYQSRGQASDPSLAQLPPPQPSTLHSTLSPQLPRPQPLIYPTSQPSSDIFQPLFPRFVPRPTHHFRPQLASDPSQTPFLQFPSLGTVPLPNDQQSQHQESSARSHRCPVPVHRDNWLDRTTAGGRDINRFGYFPDLIRPNDESSPSQVQSPVPRWRQDTLVDSPSTVQSEFDHPQPNFSEMATNSRRRSRPNDVVDLAAHSSSPSETMRRQHLHQKRSGEASGSASASGPSRKRMRMAGDDVDNLDLTGDVMSPEEKLRQAQQQEAIRSQQAAEHDKGPQRIGQRQCIICMENYTNATTTSCGHFYCHECLTQALIAGEKNSDRHTGSCPVCRKPLNRRKQNQVIPISFMKKATYDKAHGRS